MAVCSKSQRRCSSLLCHSPLCSATFGLSPIPGVRPVGELAIVKTGFTSTEGPAADAERNIYFGDVPPNRFQTLDDERESWSHSKQGGYRSKWMTWGSDSRDQHSNRLFASRPEPSFPSSP